MNSSEKESAGEREREGEGEGEREREGVMASTVEAGSSPENQKTAIQELLRGQESATRLKILIQEVLMGKRDLDPMAGELADGVLGSLARGLSAWDAGEVAEAKKEAVTPPVSNDRRTENSKRKRNTQTAARNRRDDCRRRGNPYLFKRIKSEMVDDGFAWRKYGQKEIFGAKYPRSYFRCTHKYDRGCPATRQVQRCEEEPSMYLISYMGEHTCKDSTKTSQFTTASNPTGSCVINFESNNSNSAQEVIVNSSVSLLKQECDEEVLSSPTSGCSSSVYFVSPELPALEGSMPSVEYNVGTVSDLGDASPLQSSCTSLDMGLMDGMFDLGDLFSIDWGYV